MTRGLILFGYLATLAAGIGCFGWFFAHRDHKALAREHDELAAHARSLEARNERLEAQHANLQDSVARYVDELHAVTEATRPAPTPEQAEFARVLNEGGLR